MFQPAPRRPALFPALLFVAAALLATRQNPLDASLVLGVAAILGLSKILKPVRRFDVLLLVAAWCAGLICGWQALEGRASTLGDAALVLPLGVAGERSWIGQLRESPKPIDRWTWRMRVDGLPEGEAVHLPRPIALELDVNLRDRDDLDVFTGLSAGVAVRFWARVHLSAETTFARGTIKSPKLIEPLGDRTPSAAQAIQRWRDLLNRRLRRIYAGDERLNGFLAAVLLGDRNWKDPQRDERLRACGLAHLVAISGLHAGLVAALLFGLARRVFRQPRAAAFSIGALLIGFAWMVGGATSVQRAVGCATGFLLGRSIGREGDPLNRLACVAIALGIVAPSRISSPAFLLSFAATAGILFALDRARCSRRSGLAAPLEISVAAYLTTAPLSAAYFGQLAPWAAVANLLAVPLLGITLVAGYVSLACAGVPVLGACSIAVTRFGAAGIDRVAMSFDRLPLSPWFVPTPAPWTTVAITALALAGFVVPHPLLRRWLRVAWVLALIGLHVGAPPDDHEGPGAALLDVGQGQALFWHDRGTTTLVDSAGRGYGYWDPGARVVRPALLMRGVRRIDRLVLSHGDADHAGGAFAVLDAFEVGELWIGAGWWQNPRLSDLAETARKRGTAIRMVSEGDRSAGIEVHAPSRRSTDAQGNDGSIVLSLGREPWTLFVPGDLDGTRLRELLERATIPTCRAIVLAHHGSRTGTPTRLLERLEPGVALVSCGRRNRFGHPHEEVVERLRRRRIPLWRTDHHGTIQLEARPEGWLVSPRVSSGSR